MGIDDIPNSAGELEVISTEKELHYIMNRPVSAQPYYLLLTVTDTENGELQKHLYMDSICTRNFYQLGLLVADSKEKLPILLISKIRQFPNYMTKKRKYIAKFWKRPIVCLIGIITSMAFNNFSNKTNQVWAITSEGYCSRF